MVLADEQRNATTGALANLYWTLSDHLGSVKQIAERVGSAAPSLVNVRKYDVFGNLLTETAPAIDVMFGFTGREFDKDADLQYNRARWYDAKQGRWTQEDPIREQAGDTNLYRYVGNSPADATDPSGLSWFSKIFGKAKKFFKHVAGEVGKWLDKHPVIKTAVKVANIASMVFGGLKLLSGLGKLAGSSMLGSKLAAGAREFFTGSTTAMPGAGAASTASSGASFSVLSSASLTENITRGSSSLLGIGSSPFEAAFPVANPSFSLPSNFAFAMDMSPYTFCSDVGLGATTGTANALSSALATSSTSNIAAGVAIGVPLAGMGLAAAGSSSSMVSAAPSASGSLDADPNFPGSRDVDQDPAFSGSGETSPDLDPAQVDRLATNYSVLPSYTGLPGNELMDPRQQAEEFLRHQASVEAAQQQRFQQMIDEHNQLFLYRPDRMGSAYGATTMDAGLDALGTADPTGLVDAYHAVTYVARGEWGNAGLTALGVFPILGDAFKLAKYGRAVGGVEDVYARFGPELLHQSDAVAHYGDDLFGQVDTATVHMSGPPNLTSAPPSTGSMDTISPGYRLQTQTYYPPNRGFLGDPTRQTLVPGSVVDRYGGDRGVFVAPDGTPFGARALPLSVAGQPYNRYRVVKPIEVDGGITAPWFQQPGLGTQYELPSKVRDLLRSGHLERMSP